MVNRYIQVSIVKNDVWRFTAKFKRYFLQIGCGSLHDTPTHLCAAGKGNHVDVTVFCKRLSNDRADRKSTRLNSSHVSISYAVFCLKKKNSGIEITDIDKVMVDGDDAKRRESRERGVDFVYKRDALCNQRTVYEYDASGKINHKSV